MDTFGAVLGPGLALVYLYYFPQDYKTLFLVAFIPGMLAVMTTFFLKDKSVANPIKKISVPFFLF